MSAEKLQSSFHEATEIESTTLPEWLIQNALEMQESLRVSSDEKADLSLEGVSRTTYSGLIEELEGIETGLQERFEMRDSLPFLRLYNRISEFQYMTAEDEPWLVEFAAKRAIQDGVQIVPEKEVLHYTGRFRGTEVSENNTVDLLFIANGVEVRVAVDDYVPPDKTE